MATTSPDDIKKILREHNPGYLAVSSQMRNDLRRFRSVKGWENLDAKTLRQIKAYFDYHVIILSTHWHNSSEHYLPVYGRVLGDKVDIQGWEQEVEPNRKAIRKLQTEITELFKSSPAKLGEAFETYAQLTGGYIDKEEGFIGNVTAHIPKEKFEEIEKATFKESEPKEMKVMSEWLFAGMDDETRHAFFAKMPFFGITILWKLVLSRRFAKRIAVFEQFE